MAYLGSWKIDDLVTFGCNTHAVATGAATDADAVPSYRVYEDETGTAILTGSMAKLDDANTVGFYSEQITLSAANGFEKGKSYIIYISATVATIVGTMHHTLQVEAEVDANVVSDKTGYAITEAQIDQIVDEVWDELKAAHAVADSFGDYLDDEITSRAATGDAMTLTAGERDSIAAALLDLANAIETGLTPRGALRLLASAIAGLLSGAATATITTRNAVADTKARITATVDVDGNRSAITWDVT